MAAMAWIDRESVMAVDEQAKFGELSQPRNSLRGPLILAKLITDAIEGKRKVSVVGDPREVGNAHVIDGSTYTPIHTQTHAYAYTYIHCTHTHTHTQRTHKQTHTHTHTHTHIHTHTHKLTHAHTHTHMHTHTHTHTHTG